MIGWNASMLIRVPSGYLFMALCAQSVGWCRLKRMIGAGTVVCGFTVHCGEFDNL